MTVYLLHFITVFVLIFAVLQALLLLSKFSPDLVGEHVMSESMYEAVNFILSLQVIFSLFVLPFSFLLLIFERYFGVAIFLTYKPGKIYAES
jgi:hypothetical protein